MESAGRRCEDDGCDAAARGVMCGRLPTQEERMVCGDGAIDSTGHARFPGWSSDSIAPATRPRCGKH